MSDYVAAGFDPEAFWSLTLHLFDLHMQGAAERIRQQIEVSNRQAYNTAALAGGAFAGKLPKYDRVFRKGFQHGAPQSAAVLEANIKALAWAWGAAGS